MRVKHQSRLSVAKRCIASYLLIFYAQSAFALDLMSAYDKALANDPIFRSAIKENEGAQANRVIGRAALMPQIGASYYTASNNSKIAGPQYTNGPNVITNKAYPSNNASVQLTQPIFSLDALARYRQGMAQGDVGSAKFLYQSQDLLVRVLQAYTDLLNALDQLGFLTAQRDSYLEQYKANLHLYEKGEGTITDALETKAVYEIGESQVIDAKNAVENAKRKLEDLTGDSIRKVSDVRPLLNNFRTLMLSPNSFDDWRDIALNSNPEIQLMHAQLEVARQEYKKNYAAHMPVISAVASWGQQNSYYISTINQNAVTSSIGIQATLPIFSGGETTGKSYQALVGIEKAQADADATRDRVITELRKQYDLVVSSRAKIDALNRAVESAKELTKAMRKSVAGGVRINLDILVADKGFASSQRDLAQAKYAYLLAVMKLKQQAGNLTLEDLERAAAFFKRDANG